MVGVDAVRWAVAGQEAQGRGGSLPRGKEKGAGCGGGLAALRVVASARGLGSRGEGAGGRRMQGAAGGTFGRVTRGAPPPWVVGGVLANLPTFRLFDTCRLVGKLAGQGGGARKVRACGCDELTTLRGLPC